MSLAKSPMRRNGARQAALNGCLPRCAPAQGANGYWELTQCQFPAWPFAGRGRIGVQGLAREGLE